MMLGIDLRLPNMMRCLGRESDSLQRSCTLREWVTSLGVNGEQVCENSRLSF